LSYAAGQWGFGVPPPPPDPANPGLAREPERQVPHVALRVDDGWIVASDRGEWGGEMVFVPDLGKAYGLHDGNTSDLHRLGNRIVAVAGNGHMTSRGRVYLLERGGDGRWQARPWREMPSWIGDSWLTPGGELALASHGRGTVLLASDGTLRMAPCPGR
jgi:hypothetical protein